MTGARPVVFVDPHPRRRRMIFTEAQWARLAAMAEIIEHDGDGPAPPAIVDAVLPRVDVILGQTALDAARLERADRLKAIINVEGNFTPNIDAGICFARGVEILSVAPVFAMPVAEMALALALDLARGVTSGDRAMRDGVERYGRAGNDGAMLLSRETIGLIGFGNLGRALRQLLAGFRTRLLVHDPWLPDSAIREEGCEPATLADLLAGARVIFLLAGVTRDNPGFIDRAALGRVGDGSILVLASRAAIVDFDALAAEASSGRLRVATDVFPVEPVPPDDPIRASPMLLSSHRAGGVPSAFTEIGARTLDDLSLILAGLPPARLQRAQRQTFALMRSTAGRTYSAAEAAALTAKT